MSQDWQSYIQREINQAQQATIKLLAEVVGEAMGKEQKRLKAEFEARLQAEIATLRNEFLRDRLDEARGVKRLKVVPPQPEQLIMAMTRLGIPPGEANQPWRHWY
jgi:hypothetical protein